MFHSLWFKLIGALAVVVGVALLVVTITANAVSAYQLDRFAVRNGALWAEQLARVLAERYSQDGDWRGAQKTLLDPAFRPGWRFRLMPGGMGDMMDDPQHMQEVMRSDDIWGVMSLHILVVDNDGIIVADSLDTLRGQRHVPGGVSYNTPILVEGQQVGRVIILPLRPGAGALIPGGDALVISRAVILAAIVSGVVALIVGTILFRWITHPLEQLTQAARIVASGKLAARVVGASQDELGTVAQAFNQMTAQLESQQQLRQQMVADIAHELRTPLSIIQATLEAILDGILKPNKSEIGKLHGETQRLARLVDDLRTLSLADAGQLKLEIISLDAGRLAVQIVDRMAALARLRQITLRAETEASLPLIVADPDRLAEVVTNLIDNALRHTPEGGHVTVRVVAEASRLAIIVQDDGQGIPAEELPHVFERFWRSDRSRSRASGGSGIGLSIVRQLVNLHGGTVEVESIVGGGTTFRVWLPLAG